MNSNHAHVALPAAQEPGSDRTDVERGGSDVRGVVGHSSEPAGWQDVLSGKRRWCVVEGDCLATMRGMPDACVDAVVTDPPAGIGFMGKAWDRDLGGRTEWVAWLAEIMREVLRVLKPGGHAVVWALPRTSHWTATALEDAGFEVRDCVTHCFGSGFPKSLDVSKAIDAALGAEREVVGPDPQAARRNRNSPQFGGPSMNEYDPGYDGEFGRMAATAPATAQATAYNGWGTALKPASEHWWLCRKPFRSTVAACVMEYGTGGLNIEACRVATADSLNGGAYCGDGSRETIFGLGRATKREYTQPSGRWPTNLVLTHSASCQRVGRKACKTGHSIPNEIHGTGQGTTYLSRKASGPHYASLDGTETVPAFICTPDCPVAELDRQSGELMSGKLEPWHSPNRKKGGAICYGNYSGLSRPAQPFGGDTGTASRFYPTFEWQEADFVPFRYVAKPSTAEREKGCENLPRKTAAECVDREPDSDGMKSPRAGTGRTSDGRGNHHPTVKPIALMEWLVTLVTPPGGIVLDPFTGSGTTGAACYRKGFRFVGCEREPEYVAIARARIEPKGDLL